VSNILLAPFEADWLSAQAYKAEPHKSAISSLGTVITLLPPISRLGAERENNTLSVCS
jgi:hypothetical protein